MSEQSSVSSEPTVHSGVSGFRIEVAPDCPVESIDADAH